MTDKKQEEPKQTLPAGHPQAGYLSPDTSLEDGVGLRPEVEQKRVDEANEAREKEAEAIVEHEHKVATEEQEAALKAQEKAQQETKTAEPASKAAASS